jgi:hypothetical protein
MILPCDHEKIVVHCCIAGEIFHVYVQYCTDLFEARKESCAFSCTFVHLPSPSVTGTLTRSQRKCLLLWSAAQPSPIVACCCYGPGRRGLSLPSLCRRAVTVTLRGGVAAATMPLHTLRAFYPSCRRAARCLPVPALPPSPTHRSARYVFLRGGSAFGLGFGWFVVRTCRTPSLPSPIPHLPALCFWLVRLLRPCYAYTRCSQALSSLCGHPHTHT